MKNTVFLVFTFCSRLTFAQLNTDSLFNACHSFVEYERNVFTGAALSPTMDGYYAAFDHAMRTGDGQLNIVHFGGSHIQADVWTNLVRERLQTIDTAKAGARGMLFPFKAAESNAPYSYTVVHTGKWRGLRSANNRHEGTWGVMGITALTTDTLAMLKFTFHQSPLAVKTKRLTLLANLGATAYVLTVPTGKITTETRFGDSLQHVMLEFETALDSFELVFRKPATAADELRIYGLISENDRAGVTYHSIGANGSRFVSYKRCTMLRDQLALLTPDLVIMSIGTNDSSEPDYDATMFKNNYRDFLLMVREVNPQCAFILTVPNDNFVKQKHNDNLPSVREVITALAVEFGARVWDFYGIMGEEGSAKVWRDSGMMKPDLVHFTNMGYALKGDLFYKAFLEDYLRWHTNQQQPIWNE